MAYEIHVAPNDPTNTHHIKLRKGADEMGIILCDAAGKKDAKNIQRQSYPRSAIKMYQGEEGYADSEPPFRPIAQSDFSGGRGLLTFETDARRFQDSYRADTRHAGKVFNGPLETYSTGDHRKIVQYMPGNVTWMPMYGTYLYFARSFVAPAGGMNPTFVSAILKAVGTPPDGRLEIWTNVAGAPGALIANAYYTVIAADMDDKAVSEVITNGILVTPALAAGTTYWFVAKATGAPDADNHWEVAYDSTASGKTSANGAAWSDFAGAPYFRFLEGEVTEDLRGRTFDYKGGRYKVTRPADGTASRLYINGARGAADANAPPYNKLIDATQVGWSATFPGPGAVIKIISGPGAEEATPWRVVTASAAGEATVSPNWIVPHTTDTNYVVLNTDFWDDLGGLAAQATDFAVTDEFIYFARGETAGVNVLRYQAYNSGGVWTPRWEVEDEPALFLVATRDPTLGTILWGARNAHPLHGVCVFKGRVPPAWGKLYWELGDLAPTDQPWDRQSLANVTQGTDKGDTKIDIAAGMGLLSFVAEEELADPVDITQAKKLGVLLHSSVATAAGDLRLLYSDNHSAERSPTGLQSFLVGVYADQPAARDGDAGTGTGGLTFQVGDWLYVGSDMKFNRINFDFGASVNNNASALTVQFFNGFAWAAVDSVTDGTANPAGTPFAQDGIITATINSDTIWTKNVVNSIQAYWMRLSFSIALDAVTLNEVKVQRYDQTNLSIPAHVANEWQWDTIAISPLQTPPPDCTQISFLWMFLQVDNGAQVVKMHGGIKLLSDTLQYIKLPNDARITGMWAYAGSEELPRRYPWIWTEKEFGEIQNSNGVDLYVPVALDELATLRSETNGRTHAVHNRYLWFSLGERVERYQNEQLEDVGPTLDEGLPVDRRGTPSKLLSYPGQMLLSIDAGYGSGYSSILSYTGGGWHEIYRAPKGQRIYDIDAQSIPGAIDRLWVCQGADVLWLPIDLNPLTATGYSFTHESVIYSSRVWGGMQDVLKFWKSLKMVTQSLASGIQIYGDFKCEGEANWHTLPAAFTTSMFQEIVLDYDYDRFGRYIEVRARMQTNDRTKTPIIMGWVIESLMRFEVKYVWTINFRLANNDIDLKGEIDPMTYTEKRLLLDEWLQEPTPLFVSAMREDIHDAVAFLEPTPLRPLRTEIDPEYPDESRTVDVAQLTIIQV